MKEVFSSFSSNKIYSIFYIKNVLLINCNILDLCNQGPIITIYINNCPPFVIVVLFAVMLHLTLVLHCLPACVTVVTPQVLVKVPGVDVAVELVKVNNFMPMKMGNKDLVMTHIKQPVSLGTPVRVHIVFTTRVLCTISLQWRHWAQWIAFRNGLYCQNAVKLIKL